MAAPGSVARAPPHRHPQGRKHRDQVLTCRAARSPAARLMALMAASLVDRVQVTLFPVITGQTGLDPIFQGAADFDLELVEHRTLDGHIQELSYRPTRPLILLRGRSLG